MALKGISLGLEVQDYMNDKISNKQMPSGLNEIILSKENFDLFKKNTELICHQKIPKTFI